MSDGNIISLDQFRKKKKQEQEEEPIMGSLIWLHCPTCSTLEYTEVLALHGRTHKCGTVVLEEEVQDKDEEISQIKDSKSRFDDMINESSLSDGENGGKNLYRPSMI